MINDKELEKQALIRNIWLSTLTNLRVLAQFIGIFRGEQAIYDRLDGEVINL